MRYKIIIGGFSYWCMDFMHSDAAWAYAKRHHVESVKRIEHPRGPYFRVVIERAQ